jgi:hypothetical protein
MHMAGWDKKVQHEQHRHAKSALQRERARRRDEKYAGRAGPPDVQAPAEAVLAPEPDESPAPAALGAAARSSAGIGDWQMVGRDEHSHSPGSCRPPCTSRTPARCTVS